MGFKVFMRKVHLVSAIDYFGVSNAKHFISSKCLNVIHTPGDTSPYDILHQ